MCASNPALKFKGNWARDHVWKKGKEKEGREGRKEGRKEGKQAGRLWFNFLILSSRSKFKTEKLFFPHGRKDEKPVRTNSELPAH